MPGSPQWPQKNNDAAPNAASTSRFFTSPTGFEPKHRHMGRHGVLDRPVSAIDRVETMIEADPDLRNRIVFADSFDKDSLNNALDQLNETRQKNGLTPITEDVREKILKNEGSDHTAAAIPSDPNIPSSSHADLTKDSISVIVITPESTGAGLLKGAEAYVTKDFFNRMDKAMGTQGAVLHEVGHAITTGMIMENYTDTFNQEEVADTTMVLARIAAGETGMAEKIGTFADFRSLSCGDSTHSHSADILLQLRHQLITDPAGLKQELAGKTLSQIGKIAEEMVRNPKGDSLDYTESQSAMYYASDFNSFDATIKAGERPRDVPIHTNLSRDEAVTLLRIQRAMEENTIAGSNNALSLKMPEIRDANPDAFAHADAYMRENYGPGQGAMPATPANIHPQAAAGRAAWAASRDASPKAPSPSL